MKTQKIGSSLSIFVALENFKYIYSKLVYHFLILKSNFTLEGQSIGMSQQNFHVKGDGSSHPMSIYIYI